MDAARATARLGYWLVRPRRGQGYARSAARLLVDWSLRELGLTRIELVILPANTPSRRIADALGAIDLGLHPELAGNGDHRADAHLYRISA
jgi:RimJ/RimL family protein N-acetyltransferase